MILLHQLVIDSLDFLITAESHENIQANHKTTWQITKQNHLTPRGDCIIGISATHGAKDLPVELKSYLKSGGWITYKISFEDGSTITGRAKGAEKMSFTHPTDIVFRKSSFVDERTCGIMSSLVSQDFPRTTIHRLQSKHEIISIKLISES